ncbi:hypothetical protein FF1_045938 [Malus domestica]
MSFPQSLMSDNMIRRRLIWFQAISLKERQLIGNVSLDLGLVREDAFSPVRIVSPTTEVAEDLKESKEFVPNDLNKETPLPKDNQEKLTC